VKESTIKLSIFASGSGTNAENIIKYFEKHPKIQVAEILSNKTDAYVIQRANNLGVKTSTFSKEEFTSEGFLQRMEKSDFIILAGFLWLVPQYLIEAFPDKIINIHPALLPKYGGKGMYGDRVHEAVVAAGEKESGITIHLVNEEYDKGKTLFQAKCKVEENDTPETMASKIHALEHKHFPRVIEEYILQ